MSVSVWVVLAEILTVVLAGLMGARICSLYRQNLRASAPCSGSAPQELTQAAPSPSAALEDYISELFGDAELSVALAARESAGATPSSAPVVPAADSLSAAPCDASQYHSVAALLSRRCEAGSF